MKFSYIAAVLFFVCGQAWSQCASTSIVIIDEAFFTDYRVAYTEPFSATVFTNQSALASVRVLVNGKEAVSYSKNELVNIGGGSSYRLETTIGPELSKAEVIVPLGRNYVTVEAVAADDCRASTRQAMVGADSGVHAIIVGINDYQKVKDLKFAVNDAAEFYGLLKKRLEAEKRDFISTFLRDNEATKQAIEVAVEQAVSEISSEGTVIVYFSGHGMVKAKNRSKVEAYLVPHDGNVQLETSTMLSHSDVLEMLEDAPAKNKIFILDSCFSGRGAFEELELDDRHREKFLPFDRRTELAMPHGNVPLYLPDNVLWFSSSSGGKVSYELEDLNHGLFTYYLLKIVDDAEFLSAHGDLRYSHIRDYIRNKIDVGHGSIQSPKTVGDDDIPAVGFWAVHE